MKRLRSFVSLLLVALWLPATLHCDLEAAELAPTVASCHEDHDAGEHSADHCSVVEDGAFTPATLNVKVAGPELVALCACLLCLAPTLVPLPAVAVAPSIAPPPELKVGWQFVVRAAPPARAPSLNLARA